MLLLYLKLIMNVQDYHLVLGICPALPGYTTIVGSPDIEYCRVGGWDKVSGDRV